LAAAMAASLQDVNQQQQAVRGGGSNSGGQSSRHVLTQVWKAFMWSTRHKGNSNISSFKAPKKFIAL
jgi:hypothetical protein